MSEYENIIEIIARAVIARNGKILLCRGKGGDYYFFPGGHVERGEKAEEALKREFAEELGIRIKKASFIGAVENFFADAYKHHEINIIFKAEIIGRELESKESHIEFEALAFDDFKSAKILPKALKKNVLKWMKDGKNFWHSG